MVTQLLVSETYIRENTVFSKNVDAQDIANNIGVAQDMFLEPILGTTFYDALQLSYSAQTLTANETTLMMYIKPMLAYKAAEMTLPFLTYNIKNKGPQVSFGDNSAQVDNTVMLYLKKEIENRAEWYAARLEKYLVLNGSLFPLYVAASSNQNINPDHASGYDSGFGLYDNYNCGNRCGSSFNGFWNRSSF